MFLIGLIVGVVMTAIAITGVIVWCCYKTYGSMDTFLSMKDVVIAANENRESEVIVMHEGEILETAIFKEEY